MMATLYHYTELLLTYLMICPIVAQEPVKVEKCEDDVFEAACQMDEILIINSARYGRMRLGTCLSKTYGSVGCSKNVLSLFDSWCSGRQSCEVMVSYLVRDSLRQCPKDLRGYLAAEYQCLKVLTPQTPPCESFPPVTLVTSGGYIASMTTELTRCGSIDFPWTLQAKPGQKFEFMMYEFVHPKRESDGERSSGHCEVLAVIRDTRGHTRKTICRSGQRMKHVYASRHHEVEVRVVFKQRKDTPLYFTLKYRVLNCPDIDIGDDGWFKRTSTGALVGCHSTGQTWSLSCSDNVWKGVYGNCTLENHGEIEGRAFLSTLQLSHGVSAAVVGVIAITIGAIVLLLGMLFLKRRKMAHLRTLTAREPHVKDDCYFSNQPSREVATPREASGSDVMLYTPSSVGNNYYRTWQLQRNNAGANTPSSFGYEAPPPGYPMETDTFSSRYVEHIYESPQTVRKNDINNGENSIQYFELDPNAVENKRNENILT